MLHTVTANAVFLVFIVLQKTRRRGRRKRTNLSLEKKKKKGGKNHFIGHPFSRQLPLSFRPPHASQRPRSLRCCLATAESTR